MHLVLSTYLELFRSWALTDILLERSVNIGPKPPLCPNDGTEMNPSFYHYFCGVRKSVLLLSSCISAAASTLVQPQRVIR